MPSRPKNKKPLKNKKQKHHTAQQPVIHHCRTNVQVQVPESFVETNSDVRELSGCETASVICQEHSEERRKRSEDHHRMGDSSNGKLEETHHEVQEGEVVEAVKDIASDDCSIEHAEKAEEKAEAAEETAEVVESGEVVEEKEEEVVPVLVVETEASVVEDVVEVEEKEKEEEKPYVPSVDEADEPSPVVQDVVAENIEEKTPEDLVSNGMEESIALPSLNEDITDVVSKGVEETEVPCSDEKEEEVVADVAEVVSKGIEEVQVPVVEEISTGEPSGDAYKVISESVENESLKPSPEVPVPPPVEPTGAAEEYGKREISETVENPSIVSVTRAPLQPTSWRSCCGLFEVLRRSDR